MNTQNEESFRVKILNDLIEQLNELERNLEWETIELTNQRYERWLNRSFSIIQKNFNTDEAQRLYEYKIPLRYGGMPRDWFDDITETIESARSFLLALLEEITIHGEDAYKSFAFIPPGARTIPLIEDESKSSENYNRQKATYAGKPNNPLANKQKTSDEVVKLSNKPTQPVTSQFAANQIQRPKTTIAQNQSIDQTYKH